MKSEWKVSTNYCGDMKSFHVYRLKDIEKSDDVDNREYKNQVYYKKDEAKKAAAEANKEDAERFWKGCQ